MLLTKINTTREVQVTYVHTSVGNKSLGKTVNSFALVVSLKALNVVVIDTEQALNSADDNIRLPTTNVLIHAADGDISK